METNIVHTPVLLNEALSFLVCEKKDAVFVDGTLGEGGHSEAFLRQCENLRVIGIDRDSEIIERAKKRLSQFGDRITFVNMHSRVFFGKEKKAGADLILLDLGISLYHYEESGRGFSFSKNEKLDMRLDDTCGRSAKEIIAQTNEEDLADMLFYNGGERRSRAIARAICEARKRHAIDTTHALRDIIHRTIGYRSGKIDSATRTFAALRIEVNGELKELEGLLIAAFNYLLPGGKLGVISFHSAEDRIVKNTFKSVAQNLPILDEGKNIYARILTKKPVVPFWAEVQSNPLSRSAKLRVIELV